eukprot:13528586-Heterocapsa_arctica.AAC.1
MLSTRTLIRAPRTSEGAPADACALLDAWSYLLPLSRVEAVSCPCALLSSITEGRSDLDPVAEDPLESVAGSLRLPGRHRTPGDVECRAAVRAG